MKPAMRDTQPPVLTVETLACRRGARRLVSGLNLVLHKGEVLFLTGPNGIGKTTLLRVLAGLIPPESGRILHHGDTEAPPLAYLGHGDALKPLASVRETLAFWSAMDRDDPDSPAPPDATLPEIIDALGLGPLRDLPCRYLSAGQRRRLALARIALHPGRLWLLDEPATALDTQGIAAFAALLARHRRRGGAAVIATHQAIPAEGATILDLADSRSPQDGSGQDGPGEDGSPAGEGLNDDSEALSWRALS